MKTKTIALGAILFVLAVLTTQFLGRAAYVQGCQDAYLKNVSPGVASLILAFPEVKGAFVRSVHNRCINQSKTFLE